MPRVLVAYSSVMHELPGHPQRQGRAPPEGRSRARPRCCNRRPGTWACWLGFGGWNGIGGGKAGLGFVSHAGERGRAISALRSGRMTGRVKVKEDELRAMLQFYDL